MVALKVIKAASIILQKSTGEVLVCHRAKKLKAFGDLWAFPGGKIEDKLPDNWVGNEIEVQDTLIREMLEEIGILPGAMTTIARSNRNRPWYTYDYEDDVRQEFLDNIKFVGRKRTPPFSKVCFDAAYYILTHPMVDGFDPIVDGVELIECKWMYPRDIISSWEKGEMYLPPPTVHVLRTLNQSPDDFEIRTLVETNLPIGLQTRVEFAPGIVAIPMLSRTIPPFISTNMVIITSGDQSLIVDPGAVDFDHLDQILLSLAEISHIVLTHHHQDHVHALKHIQHQFDNITVLAHRETKSRLHGYDINEIGDSILLGEREIDVIPTPGHTSGHIALFDQETSVLIAGDHMVGYGSAVLDPESGSMINYFQSTRRLLDLSIRLIIPAHGPVIYEAEEKLHEYLKHRQEREDAIFNAIQSGAKDLDSVAELVYQDVPKNMWDFAKQNIKLHIEKLINEKKISSTDF